MFEWYSLPSFAAMVVCWALAAYLLSWDRGKPAIRWTVAILLATALELMGEGMRANAITQQDWLPWARYLRWSIIVVPVLWCWITVQFVRDQGDPRLRWLGRWVGQTVMALIMVLAVAVVGGLFFRPQLFLQAPMILNQQGPFEFRLAPGPLLVPLVVAALGGVVLAALLTGTAAALTSGRARWHFVRLLVASLCTLAGGLGLAAAIYTIRPFWSLWTTPLLLGIGLGLLAVEVAADALAADGDLLLRDLAQFVATNAILCTLFTVLFVLASRGLTFISLSLLIWSLTAICLARPVVRNVRRLVDQFAFAPAIAALRDAAVQSGQEMALTRDLPVARLEMPDAADDPVANPPPPTASPVEPLALEAPPASNTITDTEHALRELYHLAALATSPLVSTLPHSLAVALQEQHRAVPARATQLEQAQALRLVVLEGIDRFKPVDREPGKQHVHYHILHMEYVRGLPNVQIQMLLSISNATFHRHRRQAIQALAADLLSNEAILTAQRREPAGTATMY